MKTNKMMRLASILLVAVMISTCAISGTFAKYVTSGESTDKARVAKFGVVVTANGQMFDTEYAESDSDGIELGANSVVSSGNVAGYSKLVAPGTSGKLVEVGLTGTPEVAVKVTYEATLKLEGWMCDDDEDPSTPEVEYCPIVFDVEGTTYGIGGTTYTVNVSCTGVADLIAKVQDAIGAHTKIYKAGTDLSKVNDPGKEEAVSVSWSWAFDEHDTKLGDYQNDVKDTSLGDKAAKNDFAKIDLTIKTTVTQID